MLTGPEYQNTSTLPISQLGSRSTQVGCGVELEANLREDHTITEMTLVKFPGTVVYKEYSTDVGDPYYPVPNKRNMDLYAKYQVCHLASQDSVGQP